MPHIVPPRRNRCEPATATYRIRLVGRRLIHSYDKHLQAGQSERPPPN
jgi:hypothetical protein